jgi:integrase
MEAPEFYRLAPTWRGSLRMLRLPQRTLAMLKRRKTAMGPGYTFVFPKLKGRTWAGEDAPRGHATDAIQNHIEKCGLNSDPQADRVTPHTFRDTFAARLVQAGVSLLKVSKLLGHATVSMTQKYAHLSPEATGAEAAAVLDNLHAIKCPEGDDPVAQDTLSDAVAQVTHPV